MKASLQKLFPVNSFARGVAVLSSGTGGAQLLLLLAAPVLTRLYSPEDFGVLAVFVSILSILGVIASLRYELAIPIAEDDQTALNVVALCLLITIGMAFFTGILVWLAGDWFAEKLNVAEVSTYFWLLPIGVFLIGIYQTFNYWATREKAFGRISKTKLTQSVSSLLVQFSFFKLGPLGLIAGYITGQVFGAGRLAKSAFDSADRRSFSFHRIKSAASRYRRFPQISSWDALLNVGSLHIFTFALASLFGAYSLGLIALANRVVHLPITFMSTSIAQVTYANLALMTSNEKKIFVSQLNLLLSYAISPLTILLIFYGENIFTVIFGDEWKIAGSYVGWIAVWTHFQFISSPVSNIFLVLEEQGKLLLFQLSLFFSRFFAILMCFLFEASVIEVVVSYSMISAFTYFLLMLWIYSAIGESLMRITQTFIPLLFIVLMLAPFYFEFSWYMTLVFSPLLLILFLFYFKKMVNLFGKVSYIYVK